ncbi:MAG: DUF1080 domain-containing protein [Opitutus sp.]|nr:DUF1080 domain-containing protein [Opitutus sp.]
MNWLVSLLLVGVIAARAAPPPKRFVALFNGRDLTGWRGGDTFDPRELNAMSEPERKAKIATWTATLTARNEKTGSQHWRVENEELVNDGYGAFATTEKDYGDIDLILDYKTVPLADSGVYLRGVPQVQIWDHTKADPTGMHWSRGSGGLWNNKDGASGKEPLVMADKPFGEWNHLRVLMVGARVSVWLNEKLVVDHAILENYYDRKLPPAQQRPVLARGPIQLQTHGEEIRWRNIFLREIGSEEACQVLAAHGGTGFEKPFNGTSLAGWAGSRDAAAVRNGAIVLQAGKAGTVYWDKALTDFQARVEYRLSAGGRSGLALRYPGKGEGVEIPLATETGDTGPGLARAARGYQHPVGDWNFEEVTVKGGTVRVERNGTVVLETELNAAASSSVPSPGLLPTRYFGLAGHAGSAEFRRIEIRKL